MKKRYPILGKVKKTNFYYWALFSYKLIRSFKPIKSYFFGFKFTQFYFSPSFIWNGKKTSVKYQILIKKKLNFFKKRGDIRRFVLFKVGSYAWKRFIFRRKMYRHFFEYKCKNKNLFRRSTKLDLSSHTIVKKAQFRLKRMYSKKIKRIKRPFNVKHKFNRLFYINRKVFQNIFNYPLFRQKRFNNSFSYLFKKNYKFLLNSFNFNLVSLLIKSRFVFTKEQALFLIKNKFVFLNGFNKVSIYQTAKQNDIIQLVLHKSYFFFFKRILSSLRLLKKKTGYRVWLLTRFLFNFYKQSPTNIPKWVDKLMYYRLDVPKFLEVDYTILTTVILYKPKYLYETDLYTFKYLNYFLLRLYVWKYIV